MSEEDGLQMAGQGHDYDRLVFETQELHD